MTTLSSEKISDYELIQKFLDLFVASENTVDLCRRMVLSDLFNDVVRGASVYILSSQTKLSQVAAFGNHLEVDSEDFSLWDDNFIAASIRTKTQVFTSESAAADLAGAISIPLLKGDISLGALTLALGPNVSTSPWGEGVSASIGKLCAFFIQSQRLIVNVSDDPVSRESIDELTTRQLKILSFMGDGMTNAEISNLVLLSESTVRQETIKIYRALAVSGRHEAVVKARALGLIERVAHPNA